MARFYKANIDLVEKVDWRNCRNCRNCRRWQYSMDAVHFFSGVNQKYSADVNKILGVFGTILIFHLNTNYTNLKRIDE